MQDEVNTKVVAIAIKGGRITAEVLKKALAKFIEEIEKAEKQASQPKTYRGKQSIKHLVEQNAAISNIEVTDGNIKSFERTANKYGIDYALKKDTSEQPPRYLVFFKGRDVDVMTQAFPSTSDSEWRQLGLAFAGSYTPSQADHTPDLAGLLQLRLEQIEFAPQFEPFAFVWRNSSLLVKAQETA